MAEGRKLLLSALKQVPELEKIDRLRSFSEEEWEALLAEAAKHSLVPLLFYYIKPYYPDSQIPVQIQDKMQRIYYSSAARNMKLYRQLKELLEKFAGENIHVLLLKGGHLAWIVYPTMALRPMADIDLLVRHDDFSRVHRILQEVGYRAAGDVSWPEKLPSYSKKDGVPVEIHAHLKSVSATKNFDINLLFGRAEKIALDETEVHVLCPEDLFLHLCLHTCVQHNFERGLISCLDVVNFVNHYNGQLDWETIWKRGEEWGIERAIYLLLALTEKLIGLRMPDKVAGAIKPSEETARVLALAEQLIFEELTDLSPHLAPLFSEGSWRHKASLIKSRLVVLPDSGKTAAELDRGKRSIKQYLSILARAGLLFSRHAKTILLGLLGHRRTVTELENRNRKNILYNWLTHADDF